MQTPCPIILTSAYCNSLKCYDRCYNPHIFISISTQHNQGCRSNEGCLNPPLFFHLPHFPSPTIVPLDKQKFSITFLGPFHWQHISKLDIGPGIYPYTLHWHRLSKYIYTKCCFRARQLAFVAQLVIDQCTRVVGPKVGFLPKVAFFATASG
jgi:hypothetical protein